MSQYIFEKNRDDQELRRLRLIEQALDEESIARLESTGVRPGWRCLELGAGAGSIAQWMGDVVGAHGQVVAVDIKTNYLQHLSAPPYTILKGDFLDVARGRFVRSTWQREKPIRRISKSTSRTRTHKDFWAVYYSTVSVIATKTNEALPGALTPRASAKRCLVESRQF